MGTCTIGVSEIFENKNPPNLPHLAKYSTNPSIGSLTEKQRGEGGTGLFTSFGFNQKNANFFVIYAVSRNKCDFFCNLCNFYNFLYLSTVVANVTK